jgi:hypothetical protein
MKIKTDKSRADKYERQNATEQTPDAARLMSMTAQQCQNCGKVHPSLDDLGYCDCRR